MMYLNVEGGMIEQFTISFKETNKKVNLFLDGNSFGDPLTDNSYKDDGYRYHDVFHLAYLVKLGWSPVIRTFLKCPNSEDARAKMTEEIISLFIFQLTDPKSYPNIRPSKSIMEFIKDQTRNFEVKDCSEEQWEEAILLGYDIWQQIYENKGGNVQVDLVNKTLIFQK